MPGDEYGSLTVDHGPTLAPVRIPFAAPDLFGLHPEGADLGHIGPHEFGHHGDRRGVQRFIELRGTSHHVLQHRVQRSGRLIGGVSGPGSSPVGRVT